MAGEMQLNSETHNAGASDSRTKMRMAHKFHDNVHMILEFKRVNNS